MHLCYFKYLYHCKYKYIDSFISHIYSLTNRDVTRGCFREARLLTDFLNLNSLTAFTMK